MRGAFHRMYGNVGVGHQVEMDGILALRSLFVIGRIVPFKGAQGPSCSGTFCHILLTQLQVSLMACQRT